MHLQIPLKNLRFGHEAPVHPSNARITGRLDGVETLAVNIHSRGLIEDLVVFDDGVPDTWFVSEGNRSLAALRLIHGDTSTELIDCKSRPAEDAFEDSLAVAVLSHKLHPVDEYEGFARLRDERGKTEEEIAHQYGKTAREVAQVMALGHLSANVRDAWRKGEIKAEAAKAFTLAPDHKTQDKILDDLRDDAETGRGGDLIDVEGDEVKSLLKIGNDNSGTLVEFVGIEPYVKRGGKITRDLFGTDHKVSDAKLAKAMAAEKLKEECKKLVDAGWSFAVTLESLRNRHDYSALKVDEALPSEEEIARLAELNLIFNEGNRHNEGHYSGESLYQLTAAQQASYLEYHELVDAIELRRYPDKLRAKAGCFVGIDNDGLLDIEYGRVKPAQKAAAAEEVKAVKRDTKKAEAKAVAEGRPAPESTKLSNALKERLETQLISATRDAIGDEPQLVNSPLFEVLAKIICAQINPNRSSVYMPDAIRTKLAAIRQVLNPAVFNEAIVKRFEAENYFSSAPKGIVLKAIAEGINPDEARKVASKTKAEIWKFALGNLGRTGWLPKELRTVHYAGPGSEGYQRPPAPASDGKHSEPKADEKTRVMPPRASTPTTAEQVAKAKQARATKAGEVKMKRAAAAKKSAKKTSAKKKKS